MLGWDVQWVSPFDQLFHPNKCSFSIIWILWFGWSVWTSLNILELILEYAHIYKAPGLSWTLESIADYRYLESLVEYLESIADYLDSLTDYFESPVDCFVPLVDNLESLTGLISVWSIDQSFPWSGWSELLVKFCDHILTNNVNIARVHV